MTVILKPASDLKKTSRLSVDVADTVRPVLKAFTKQSGVIREIPLWQQQAKLVASDDQLGDEFGEAVAISGDYVVVGAPREDTGGASAGAAYVFVRSGTSWVQQAKLVASDAQAGDEFGEAVAISGDYVVVGARFEDTGGTSAGAAYVFVRSGTSWVQQAKLVASDAQAGDEFGSAVAISGDYVVVGAPREDTGGSTAGAAYVLVRSGTSWVQQAKLAASDAQADDLFGSAVAISGDYVVVGAWFEDTGGADAGAAYVFVRSGTSWVQQAKLAASDAQADDLFGSAVAISGDYVVVGATGEDTGGTSAGAAYVFVRSGTSWVQQAKLVASDAQATDLFGEAVAISGDYVVVGAPLQDTGATNTGAIYVF